MEPITDVTVKLIGEDGNAFSILGKVSNSLKRNGYKKEASDFLKEATSGDYDHLLQTCNKYVHIE